MNVTNIIRALWMIKSDLDSSKKSIPDHNRDIERDVSEEACCIVHSKWPLVWHLLG
jgi:hypothetical protein